MPKKISGKLRRAASKPKPYRPVWESRALLSSIVDSSDDAIIGKTLDGIITSWNRGAERIYGYRAEEVIGKPISILAPDDRAGEIPSILKRIRQGERVEHYESERLTNDNRRINVAITVSPIRDSSGKIVGASTIARDITVVEQVRQAQQESEARAQALFLAASQAIVIVDAAGKIVMVNPATQAMFGYSLDELLRKPVELLVPQQLRAGHKAHRDDYFRDPQMRPMGIGMDLQACRKDGTSFFAEISLSYIQSAHGTLGVAFVTDISRRRADEQAIREQAEDLRSLAARLMTAQDDERRRIARDLHDDLSQKLAFLAIDLGKLATKSAASELTTEIRPLQLRAADSAETVRRISHQLHPSVLDDIGLEAALEQYAEEFEQRTGIGTSFSSHNMPDSLPREISASIYHIAQECLRNVSKHSRTETVKVDLEYRDNLVRLTVRDEGIGLTTDQTARGIGIVAMKERAHLVNGKLSIQSEAGAGTEVSVEVPVGTSA